MESVPANDLEKLLSETDWLARLASSLTADPQGAEDLAQETWLAALRRPPTRAGDIRPWLATIARNAARFDRRSRGARRGREAARALESPRDAAPAPEELLARAETQEVVSRLVRELPPELSEVVLLTFHEGRTSAWIARQREIPAATVRARKQRAIELLRERLDTHHDGDRQAWLSALAPLAATAGRRAAGAPAPRGFPAGSLAPCFAMSLPIKLASIAALALLALLPWIGSDSPTTHSVSTPDEAQVARATDAARETTPRAPALDAPTHRTPVDALEGAADSDAPPVTRVRLRVVDPLGRPVANATVTPTLSFRLQEAHAFLREELGAVRMLTLQAEMVRRTAADGSASWETDLLRESGLVNFMIEGPRLEVGSLRVELEPGMDEDLGEVTLAAAGGVSGRMHTAAGDEPGRLVVELGPVELPTNERSLEHLRAAGPQESVGYEHSHKNGEFRLTGIPPGEYRVYAHPLISGRGAWSEPIVVNAGLVTEGVEFEVEAVLPLAAEILVLGADGEPLLSAHVRIEGQGRVFSGTVNKEGRYVVGNSFGAFAGGRATVSDRHFQHHTAVVDPLPLEAERVVVQLEPAEVVTHTLNVRGIDGSTVEAAEVGITAPIGSRWWSGVNGSVELTVPADSEGSFELDIRARGFAPGRIEGLIASKLPEDWSVELTPQRGISGVVLSGGEPLRRARIELHWQVEVGHVEVSGTEVRSVQDLSFDEARTAQDGRFCLHGDTDGDLALIVSHVGHADAVVLLTDYVAAGGWQEIVVELDEGGIVRGRVVDSMGAAIQGERVVLDHPLHSLKSTLTQRDGSFRFRRVPAGDWYLRCVDDIEDGFLSRRIELPDGWEFPVNCTVTAGGEVVHELRLPDPEGTRVAGRVRCTGADPGKLGVRVYTADGGTFRTDPFAESWETRRAIDDGGRYEVRLREGRDYVLRISAPRLGAELSRSIAANELPRWDELELELASLSFARTGDAPSGAEHRNVMVSWRDGGWAFNARLKPEANGLPAPILVPAGELELSWQDAQGENRTRTLRIETGEEREVRLE